jgi:hypothetical protein
VQFTEDLGAPLAIVSLKWMRTESECHWPAIMPDKNRLKAIVNHVLDTAWPIYPVALKCKAGMTLFCNYTRTYLKALQYLA